MNQFFKVIVISIGLFESKIIDERHFDSEQAARKFIAGIEEPNVTSLLITM